ncbi:MAG TPA: hypothetical protein VFE13_01585, partial [Caulobacteraceae bacterium]|nr:hypothetical protein [Caulobacteraceae bacterium]
AFSSGETVSWNQTGTSGTLTVRDGTQSASLVLKGSYVASEFQLSDDGHGGTLVADPPARAATRGARLTQAAAAFGGGRSDALATATTGPRHATSAAAALLAPAISGG